MADRVHPGHVGGGTGAQVVREEESDVSKLEPDVTALEPLLRRALAAVEAAKETT
jgi:hypothetical protein